MPDAASLAPDEPPDGIPRRVWRVLLAGVWIPAVAWAVRRTGPREASAAPA